MRFAHTAARGIITNMNVAIMTPIRICIRYCRNAVNEPISMAPASTRCAPNQRTAMLETLKKIFGSTVQPIYKEARQGDVRLDA